jgi:hypothetical protein
MKAYPLPKSSGFVTIQMIGLILLSLMLSSIAIDVAYYFAAQNQLQSAANAGALAGVKDLFTNQATTPADRRAGAAAEAVSLVGTYSNNQNNIQLSAANDVEFGFIDPTTQIYDPANFTTPTGNANYAKSGGFNAVRVTVKKLAGSPSGTIKPIMAQMLGVTTMPVAAQAVAMLDGHISEVNGGLRPFFGCLQQFNVANADGHPETHTVQIYGETLTVDGVKVADCPLPPSGNWGFSDLSNSNGSIGTPTLIDWILNGYPGTVDTGSNYSFDSSPGNNVSSDGIRSALDTLIANQTVIMVPLIDSIVGTGSTAEGHVVGYAGLVIESYVATGNQAKRAIYGHFTNITCTQNCNLGGTTFGAGSVKIRLAG